MKFCNEPSNGIKTWISTLSINQHVVLIMTITKCKRNVPCFCVFCLERWPRRRDWPKILREGVRVWCGEELWVSGTGGYLYYRSMRLIFLLYIHPYSSVLPALTTPVLNFCCIFLLFRYHDSHLCQYLLLLSLCNLSLSVFFFIVSISSHPVLSHLCVSLTCFSSFVLQTRDSAHTLSAMTAGIRRNWIEVLKKCIRPSSSPDLTQ